MQATHSLCLHSPGGKMQQLDDVPRSGSWITIIVHTHTSLVLKRIEISFFLVRTMVHRGVSVIRCCGPWRHEAGEEYWLAA